MALFKRTQKQQHTQKTTEPVFTQQFFVERIYQYADGTFLPDTSQPNLGAHGAYTQNHEINTGAYTPHESTRYMNVVIGGNNLPQSRGTDTDKALPSLYTNRENCCGCTACYAICPMKAICMRPCCEGFMYPVVDANKCVRCYQCVKVCPIKTEIM